MTSTALRFQAGHDLSVELPTPRPGGLATWMRGYTRRIIALDLVLSAAASVAALAIRFGDSRGTTTWTAYAIFSVLLPIFFVGSLGLSRVYELRFLGKGSEEMRRIFDGAARLTALLAIVSFAVKADIARGYVVIAMPLAALLVLANHAVGRISIARARAKGDCLHRVLVVGEASAVAELSAQMRSQPDAGYSVIGACTTTGDVDLGLTRAGVPVFGELSGVLEAVWSLNIDTVAVAPSAEMRGDALRDLAWGLEATSVDLLVGPALTHVAGNRIHIRPVPGLPLLHVEQPELSGARRLVKTAMDRGMAALVLLLASPVLVAVGIAVKLDSEGPAIFRQTRVGRDGKTFTMFKFRSMSVDAEARLRELQELNENSDGLLFKIKADPRITRVGGILRRLSIDELPQLWNVVRGDMSLVGPRPPLPAEVEKYGRDVRRRLLVKPGLTGLWQVSGRSDLDWDESVRLDLHYVENWSLALDLSIIVRTLRAVLGSSGAY